MDFLIFRNVLLWAFAIFLTFVTVTIRKYLREVYNKGTNEYTKLTRYLWWFVCVLGPATYLFIMTILILGATGVLDKF